MKQERQRQLRVLRKFQLIVCALMVGASLLCFGAWQYFSNLLDSQKAAERWQGEGDLEFSQVTCFLPADQMIGLKEISTFRNAVVKKLQDAALDLNENPHLVVDAWSTSTKLYTSGEHGRGEASVIAVGGDYFEFHPLRLLSGDYIRQSDLMKDRIVLGEEVAWLLFGGTDLAGMTMKLNGTPYVIAGVVEQEQDRASKKCNSDGLDLYMSYDALLGIDKDAKINCYELVMANPVKNFALSTVNDKFPIGRGTFICNTDRYGYARLLDQAVHFSSRSSQISGAVLPYWENAARVTEDWGALCCFLGTGLLFFPLVILVTLLFRSGKRIKTKLEDDILPDLSEKTSEAIRKGQRRRWERRHREDEK